LLAAPVDCAGVTLVLDEAAEDAAEDEGEAAAEEACVEAELAFDAADEDIEDAVELAGVELTTEDAVVEAVEAEDAADDAAVELGPEAALEDTTAQMSFVRFVVKRASLEEQAFRTHGEAEVRMAVWPVVHWQAKSVALQPELPMAVNRQLWAQAGMAAWSCAMLPV